MDPEKARLPEYPAPGGGVLSAQMLQDFNEYGFLILKDFVSEKRFFMEADAFLENGGLRQSKEHSLNKMGHAMHDLDPVFDAFSRTPELAAVAQSVGFERPAVLQSMYIFKPPNIGGEVVCHQDSTFGLHRRIDGLTRLRRPNRLSPSLPSSGCDKICLI